MDNQDAAAELLIQRKRKRWRTAVDPCLGVYLRPSSSSICADFKSFECKPAPLAKNEVKEQDHKNIVSDIVHAICPDASEQIIDVNNVNGKHEIASVTVDDFLENVSTKPTKVYRKRRKRRAAKAPLHEWPESPLSSCDEQPRRPRRRNAKPLAERMFQAAVLSHVDHDQIPEPYHPSRRPLPFVRDDCNDGNRNITRKRRALTLVDPRKTSPFRHAIFSPPTSAFEENYVIRKTRAANRQRHTKNRGNNAIRSRKKQIPVSVSDCLPLSFVPLVDLEEIYKDRCPRKAKLEYSHQTTGPVPVLHSQLAFMSPPTSAVSCKASKTLGPPSPSQKGTICYSSGYPDSPVTALAVDNHHPVSKLPAVTSGDPHIATKCIGVETGTDDVSLLPSQTEGLNINNKPYKKLASLLGGLLETARNAALKQDAENNTQSKSTVSRKRKGKLGHAAASIAEPGFSSVSHPA